MPKVSDEITNSKELTDDITGKVFMEEMLTACASSPRADKITYVQDNGKKYHTRAQIHTLLLGAFGSGKTSSLISVDNAHILTDVTMPHIVGTIDPKTNQYIEGAIIKAAGKTFIIDEVQQLTNSARFCLLNLLEHQFYNRGLGYKINAQVSEKRKLYSIHTRPTGFDITSRFSSICSGVYVPGKTANPETYKMWTSRFVPVNIKLTLDDIEKMLMGKGKIDIETKEYKGKVTFPQSAYRTYIKRYMEVLKSLKFKEHFINEHMGKLGYIARNANDMARYACYLAGTSNYQEVHADHYEQALNLMPLALYNFISSSLTQTDYSILSHYENFKQEEIADILDITQSCVAKHVFKLREKGLIN